MSERRRGDEWPEGAAESGGTDGADWSSGGPLARLGLVSWDDPAAGDAEARGRHRARGGRTNGRPGEEFRITGAEGGFAPASAGPPAPGVEPFPAPGGSGVPANGGSPRPDAPAEAVTVGGSSGPDDFWADVWRPAGQQQQPASGGDHDPLRVGAAPEDEPSVVGRGMPSGRASGTEAAAQPPVPPPGEHRTRPEVLPGAAGPSGARSEAGAPGQPGRGAGALPPSVPPALPPARRTGPGPGSTAPMPHPAELNGGGAGHGAAHGGGVTPGSAAHGGGAAHGSAAHGAGATHEGGAHGGGAGRGGGDVGGGGVGRSHGHGRGDHADLGGAGDLGDLDARAGADRTAEHEYVSPADAGFLSTSSLFPSAGGGMVEPELTAGLPAPAHPSAGQPLMPGEPPQHFSDPQHFSEAHGFPEAQRFPEVQPFPEAQPFPATQRFPEAQPIPAGAPVHPMPPGPPPPPEPPPLRPDTLLPPSRPLSEQGWRRMVFRLTGGAVNPGPSAREIAYRELLERVRAPLEDCHRVAVLSLKGGVGKTTATVAIGAILASLRGDRVVALDANPDRGTLGGKVPRQSHASVRDLLDHRDEVTRYVDIRRYVSQAESRLEILASDEDPEVSQAFSDDDYRAVDEILRRYYSILITDCGTGMLHSPMHGVLSLADSLVVVSTASVDGAQSASATLDWLDAHGYADLVSDAVTVVSSIPATGPPVNVDVLEQHFALRTRQVVQVPYDRHLATGGTFDLEALGRGTQQAYLEVAAAVADRFRPPRAFLAPGPPTGAGVRPVTPVSPAVPPGLPPSASPSDGL